MRRSAGRRGNRFEACATCGGPVAGRREIEGKLVAEPCGHPVAARRKYGNKKITLEQIPGRLFDSEHEAREALKLWIRQRDGEISNLRFQVPYDLVVNGEKVCRYVADFVWEEPPSRGESYLVRQLHTVVADAKGVRTEAYRLKKRLMRACHGIEIKEL